MNSDYKRIPWFVVMTGIVIIGRTLYRCIYYCNASHSWKHWYIGIPEIASVCFFLGLFIFVVGTGLAKVSVTTKRRPIYQGK